MSLPKCVTKGHNAMAENWFRITDLPSAKIYLLPWKLFILSAFAQVKSRAWTKRNTAVVEARYNWFAVLRWVGMALLRYHGNTTKTTFK